MRNLSDDVSPLASTLVLPRSTAQFFRDPELGGVAKALA